MRLTDEELEAFVEKESRNNDAEPLHGKDAMASGDIVVTASEESYLSGEFDEEPDIEEELQNEEAVSDLYEEENDDDYDDKADEEASFHPSESVPVKEDEVPPPRRKLRRRRRDPLQWLNGNAIKPLLKREFLFPALWIAFLFFCNIYLGFLKIDKIRKIDELETRLRKIYYKQLFTTGEISNMDRREAVWERLQERGSTLAPPNDAPFVIYYDGKVFAKEKKDREKRS